MKLKICVFLFLFPFLTFSQMNNVKGTSISVNWNKTTHLIFPSEISYFSSVDDLVVGEKRHNTLSLKANEKDFNTKTTLTVATKDGRFYVYNVFYLDKLDKTAFNVDKNNYLDSYSLGINDKNNIHLLFPDVVEYLDFGSSAIEVEEAASIQNLIKIKTKEKFDFETNVTVKTKGNKFYVFNVNYDDKETNFVHSLDSASVVELVEEELTDAIRQNLSDEIKRKPRDIFSLGMKKNKIEFSIHNLLVRKNKLFFHLNLSNLSHIDYDIDYLKFYIVDRKKNSKTASQDLEIFPLFLDEYVPFVKGMNNIKFSVCFDKFTIADDKLFVIDITERGGGRNIKYKIKNKDIINAKTF